jgi:hypothetical protein
MRLRHARGDALPHPPPDPASGDAITAAQAMHIAKSALNRIGAGTIGRQHEQGKAGCCANHRSTALWILKLSTTISTSWPWRPRETESRSCSRSGNSPKGLRSPQQWRRGLVASSSALAKEGFSLVPRGHDLPLGAVRHPCIADLGQKIAMESICEHHGLVRFQLLAHTSDRD